MNALIYLIPAALLLGGLGLAAFMWTLKSGQYSDLDGAPYRILFDDDQGLDGEPGGELTRSQSEDKDKLTTK